MFSSNQKLAILPPSLSFDPFRVDITSVLAVIFTIPTRGAFIMNEKDVMKFRDVNKTVRDIHQDI